MNSEARESVDPATEMDVHLTGTGIRLPKEKVVQGEDIRIMDLRASLQLKEESNRREKTHSNR